MKIKIWKKISNKLDISGNYDVSDDLEAITTAKNFVLSSLKDNIDYGYIFIDQINYDKYSKIIEVSPSFLAQLLIDNKNHIMTLSFTKKDGKDRTLTGFTNGDTDPFGRFYFVEPTVEDEQIRLVDPRSLNWVQVFSELEKKKITYAKKDWFFNTDKLE